MALVCVKVLSDLTHIQKYLTVKQSSKIYVHKDFAITSASCMYTYQWGRNGGSCTIFCRDYRTFHRFCSTHFSLQTWSTPHMLKIHNLWQEQMDDFSNICHLFCIKVIILQWSSLNNFFWKWQSLTSQKASKFHWIGSPEWLKITLQSSHVKGSFSYKNVKIDMLLHLMEKHLPWGLKSGNTWKLGSLLPTPDLNRI